MVPLCERDVSHEEWELTRKISKENIEKIEGDFAGGNWPNGGFSPVSRWKNFPFISVCVTNNHHVSLPFQNINVIEGHLIRDKLDM